jgi:DNA-directed RNA polymerase subunit RPC12/RpoP
MPQVKITCPRCKTEYQIEAPEEKAKFQCEECKMEFFVNPPKNQPAPNPTLIPVGEPFEPSEQKGAGTSGFGFDAATISARGRKGDMYVVKQVVLTEKFLGTGSGENSLTNLQSTINTQVAKGYRLHTISTTSSGSKGFLGGDKIQATLTFEKVL